MEFEEVKDDFIFGLVLELLANMQEEVNEDLTNGQRKNSEVIMDQVANKAEKQ